MAVYGGLLNWSSYYTSVWWSVELSFLLCQCMVVCWTEFPTIPVYDGLLNLVTYYISVWWSVELSFLLYKCMVVCW